MHVKHYNGWRVFPGGYRIECDDASIATDERTSFRICTPIYEVYLYGQCLAQKGSMSEALQFCTDHLADLFGQTPQPGFYLAEDLPFLESTTNQPVE